MRAHLLLLVLLIAPLARGATLLGQVAAVTSGDTLQVADARSGVRHTIRLAGVAAPDRYQDFGPRAQQELASLLFGRDVRVEGGSRDRTGRLLARVFVAAPGCHGPQCPKDVDAGFEQVRGGFAWWYRDLAAPLATEDRARYEQAEFQARIHRAGLWAARNPVPPWAWRPLR